MFSKKAAMEMSMGTIVTIVLLMSVLILGLVFVKNIMCSGIILTDDISSNVKNEIKGLFGTKDFGVKCMGEGGHEVKLGDGGRRQIVCMINTDETTDYILTIKEVLSLRGTETGLIENWILDEGWEGTVSPGQKTVTVMVLDVPKKISDTNLKIEIEEENLNTGNKVTHISYIDLTHVGALTSAVC